MFNSLQNNLPKLIVITGTNASGKSALGIQLAQVFHGEIISADSRQIFQGFDLCCGKVTPQERALVPHHLLDIRQVGDPYSAADFQRDVYALVPQIIQRKHLPFLVGGTGLYLSAVVYGYSFREETIDETFRHDMESKSLEELLALMPEPGLAYLSTNPSETQNKRRVIRILERLRNGEDLVPHNNPRFSTLQLGVRWEKPELDRRIDERLQRRLDQGMIDEVQTYLNNGGDPDVLRRLGLEYRYITDYLSGCFDSYDSFCQELSHAIKQFAKRQLTWFRRDDSIHWLDMLHNPVSQAQTLIENFLSN